MDYTTFFVIFLGAALLATSLAKYIRLSRVIKRLKQLDTPQWVCMGSPEATFFSKYRDYTTWRSPELAAVPTSKYSELSLWLSQREYESLNDDQLTVNANRYRQLGNLQSAICAIALCAIIYLHFVDHRRVG